MDDEFETEDEYTPSFPWSWTSAGVIVADFVTTVLDAASTMVHQLNLRLAASANHAVDQRVFRDEVARDIETITKEE